MKRKKCLEGEINRDPNQRNEDKMKENNRMHTKF